MESVSPRDRLMLIAVVVLLGLGVSFSVLGNPFSSPSAPPPTSPTAAEAQPTTPVGQLDRPDRGGARLGLDPASTQQLFAQLDASLRIMAGFGRYADGEIGAQRARCPAPGRVAEIQRTVAEYCELVARVGVSLNSFAGLCPDLDLCGAAARESSKVLDALATQTRTVAKAMRAQLPAGRCRTGLLPTHDELVAWRTLGRIVGQLGSAAGARDPAGIADAVGALDRFVRRAQRSGAALPADPDAVMSELARRCTMRWIPAAAATATTPAPTGAAAPTAGPA